MNTLPVIRYPVSIVSFAKDSEAADETTQKLLTTYISFHPKSNT